MTTHSRIAAFLSTSALCLGLVAAPSFAAPADPVGTSSATTSESGKAGQHKHAKGKTHHHAKPMGKQTK
ncbi:hypothetical protein [Bordetella avium]|uniref:Exported protein n=1 Tax=Bordetella avium (strain 197N) TaxID=360910 RepID=Q2KXV6_BORA1|nr:hypothetical protein [Bordetella avium]AZY53132.1 hypothetical protein C0J07_11975 [Bordetella avium]RIQ12524.1 hypothetical protein D0432_12875 [Bordetella avium]RIQ17615.1 hypothetical protein D0850_09065 [Bordetella avium]RIQ32272.1 hypothetical protein D0849_12110 [Bordetella avium]RIQ37239.1 hypothetical protein D0848_13635 [Bordetella avium]